MSKDEARQALLEQRASLRSRLVSAGLGDELAAQALLAATEAIAIKTRPATRVDRAVGATRLGGRPDLCGGSWPEEEGYELRFIGQFRLPDLAPHDLHDRLPPGGLLSFFIGHPTDFDADPMPIARVLHIESSDGLTQGAVGEASKPVGLDLAPKLRLPPYGSHRFGDDERYRPVFDELYLASGVRLHGFFEQDRRWERAVEPGEVILLRLDADREVPYELYEVQTLYFVIGERALANGHFSDVRVHEGGAI